MSVKIVLAALSLSVTTCFASSSGDAKVDKNMAENKDKPAAADIFPGADPSPTQDLPGDKDHNNNTFPCGPDCKEPNKRNHAPCDHKNKKNDHKHKKNDHKSAADKDAKVADKDAKAADKDDKAADKDAKAADKDAKAADKDAKAADKDAKAADKDAKAADKDAKAAEDKK